MNDYVSYDGMTFEQVEALSKEDADERVFRIWLNQDGDKFDDDIIHKMRIEYFGGRIAYVAKPIDIYKRIVEEVK